MIRTRFAPSLTGYIHLGNLRSALFSYLIAKHENGKFVLRLEDTDQKHNAINADQFVYDMLRIFNLNYDEGPNKEGEYGPYIQSERLNIYRAYAERLVEKGAAYYCFCDEKTLSEQRITSREEKKNGKYEDPCRIIAINEAKNRVRAKERHVIRQRMPENGQTSFIDLVYGGITVENSSLENQILIKSNGYPTYNFANVIDDALMHITHVTRGCEYITSTPKYILLYDALNFPRPEFIHLPHVIKKGNSKLSKRSKDDNLLDLLKQGFLPAAIINYIALLGWSPKTNQEFFSLEELVDQFEIKNITKAPSCYDIKKLEWFNKHYIMKMNEEEYLKYAKPFLEKFYNLQDKSEEWINCLLMTCQNQIHFGAEIPLITNLFFNESIELSKEQQEFLNSIPNISNTLKIFKEEINNCNNWDIENIKLVLKNTEEKSGLTKKQLYMPIRLSITGSMHGPSLIDTIYLLGKETILKRL